MLHFRHYIRDIIASVCALAGVGVVGADSPPYITIDPTPVISPLPLTTFGANFDNLTASNFSIIYFPGNALSPYAWTTMNNLSVPCFLVFLFIYLGMWLSNSNLRLASITGILFAGAFLFAGGIGVALPVVIQPLAWGALVASITGITLSMFKNVG